MRNFKLKDISSVIVGFALFLLTQPYFIWGLSVQVKLCIQIVPIMFFLLHNNFSSNRKNLVLFVSLLSLLLFSVLLQRLSFYYGLFMVSFAIIPFVKYGYAHKTYTSFRIIYAIFLSVSLVVWLLVLLGVTFPYTIIEPLNPLKQYNYSAYPFMVMPNSILGLGRFFGLFDEPGVIGTISLMVLYIEKYNFKKLLNIPIFISGFFSMSLFFILGTLIFLFVKYVIFKPKYAFFVAVFLGVLYLSTKNIEIIKDMVYSRLEWDSSANTISGNNRATDDLIHYFNSIRGSKTYFFGADENTIELFSGSAGYRNAILQYGFVFCFLYIVIFFMISVSRGLDPKSRIAFLAFLVMVIYQRPGFCDAVYMFMFSQFIYSLQPKIQTLEKPYGFIR